MKNFIKYCCFLCLASLFSICAFSQVSVTGPQCVMVGTVYQYTIHGNWDSLSTMQVCVTSGSISDSVASNSCTIMGGAPLATVLIIWNDSSSESGAISLTSSKGNATLSVNFAVPLLPGSIDSMDKAQVITGDSIPSSIHCSPDKGGSCNPTYSDQWQQSPDMVSWTDMTGAKSESLPFNSPPLQTTFYRRKVTETNSGTIAYSDVAIVNVQMANSLLESKKLRDINRMLAAIERKKQFQLTLKSITK